MVSETTYRDFLPGTFDFADVDQVDPDLRVRLREALASGPYPILIHGNPGNGKSSAAAIAVAGHLKRNGPATAWFWLWERVVQDIQTARKRKDRCFPVVVDGEEYQRRESFIWEKIASSRFLCVFDDFGIQKPAEWERGLAFELVEKASRTNTIFTSNASPEQMMKNRIIDARTASRLNGGTVIAVSGKDRREGQRVVV